MDDCEQMIDRERRAFRVDSRVVDGCKKKKKSKVIVDVNGLVVCRGVIRWKVVESDATPR